MSLPVSLVRPYRDDRNPSMRRYADMLGAALGRRGVDVSDVRLPPGSPTADGLAGRVDSLWARYVRYPALARSVRRGIAHVLDHSHAHLVPHLGPARTVVTCHDVMLLALAAGRIDVPPQDRLATTLFRRDVSHLCGAAAVVAVSAVTRNDLVELVGVRPDRIEVIPPGVDIRFRHDPGRRRPARERLGLRGHVVLTVGHSGFYKNVEGCLNVLQRVRASGLDATLVRAGEPLRPSQRILAGRLGVADAVRDLGRVDGAALEDLYAGADVLLFPSLYEGFGWPPLEAMASGLPAVTSASGSLREVVADAALTADPRDHAGLAGAVLRLAGDPALAAEMRTKGLARARQFDWDETARRMVALYERVARDA